MIPLSKTLKAQIEQAGIGFGLHGDARDQFTSDVLAELERLHPDHRTPSNVSAAINRVMAK